MVFAFHVYRGCLPTVLAHFFGEMHRIANIEVIEVGIDHAVAVEINMSAVACLDRSVILVRHEGDNAAVGRNFMGLYLSPTAVATVFQLPRDSIEGIANCNVDVLVRLMFGRIPAGDEFGVRNFYIYANMVQIALLMVLVMRLDDDPATHDFLAKLLKFPGSLTDFGFDEFRRLDVTKYDL